MKREIELNEYDVNKQVRWQTVPLSGAVYLFRKKKTNSRYLYDVYSIILRLNVKL